MGLAVIVANKGAGLYSIQPLYDMDRAAERHAKLITKRGELADQLFNLETELLDLSQEHNSLLGQLDAAIEEDKGVPPFLAYEQALRQIGGQIQHLRTQLDIKEIEKARLLVEDASVLQEANAIESALNAYRDNTPAVDAWCATLTTDLSVGQEVSTIELNDETNPDNDQPFIIYPNGNNVGGRKVQPVISSDSMAIVYNLTALPGFQKWKPRYRKGVITKLNGDVCDVLLGDDLSSIKGEHGVEYYINDNMALSDVEIVYPPCDGEAFIVGDTVVVAMHKLQSPPQVVGFVDHPQGCILDGPPIPWITVTVEISGTRVHNEYSDTYAGSTIADTFEQEQGYPAHLILEKDGDLYLAGWNVVSQTNYAVLLDDDDSPIMPGGTYGYQLGYFSANIPSLVVSATPVDFSLPNPSTDYTRDGNEFISGSETYTLVSERAEPINKEPSALGPAITTFTMQYQNEDPYTGGAFPSGSGSKQYRLNRTYTSGVGANQRRWAEYLPVE